MRRDLSLALSLLTAGATLVAAARPLSAEDGNPLTEVQVACNRAQLRALVERTSVTASDGSLPPAPHSLLVSYSSRFGTYEGLAVGLPASRSGLEPLDPGLGPGQEWQLAFHLSPSVRRLLLNPDRQPLDQVSLTREASTSTLVDSGSGHAIQVRLRPTLGPQSAGGPPAPGDLVVDNLATPPPEGGGFLAADTKPGRGLTEAGLTRLCHSRFTEIDRKVFAILQRTLRVNAFDPLRELRYDTRIALYRHAEPGVFGADVYVVDPTSGELFDGSLHVQIRAHTGPSGALEDGEVTAGHLVLPEPASLVGEASIVEPLFGGVEAGYEVVAASAIDSGIPGFESFDWRDVLEETAWNPASPLAPACGRGTVAELEATPREDGNLELLALALGHGLTAEQAVYDRLVRDVTAIRAADPDLAAAGFLPSIDGRQIIVGASSLDVFEAMMSGDYDAWDCLNDWYGLEEIDSLTVGSHGYAVLTLEGRYDLEQVAEDYEELPDVSGVGPNFITIPGIPEASLCASIEEDGIYHYFFQVRKGSYLFTTTAGGEVDLAGHHDADSAAPAPPWLPLARACFRELRFSVL